MIVGGNAIGANAGATEMAEGGGGGDGCLDATPSTTTLKDMVVKKRTRSCRASMLLLIGTMTVSNSIAMATLLMPNIKGSMAGFPAVWVHHCGLIKGTCLEF